MVAMEAILLGFIVGIDADLQELRRGGIDNYTMWQCVAGIIKYSCAIILVVSGVVRLVLGG
jgi:hypothetical protein